MATHVVGDKAHHGEKDEDNQRKINQEMNGRRGENTKRRGTKQSYKENKKKKILTFCGDFHPLLIHPITFNHGLITPLWP